VTPTVTPTISDTPAVTPTTTATPTVTATVSDTPAVTPTTTATPTVSATDTPVVTPTNTPTPTVPSAIADLDPAYWYKEEGIVGSAPVTEWTNSGSAGSAGDFDVVVGTGANLTTSTLNGHTGVSSSGSAGLETTSGIDIGEPFVVFTVFKPSNSSPSAITVIWHNRSDSGNIVSIATEDGNNDEWYMWAGTYLRSAQTYDINARLFTSEFRGDATSKFTISDLGNVTGDAGSNNWDLGTILTNYDNSISIEGALFELVVFTSDLSGANITAVQEELEAKYAI